MVAFGLDLLSAFKCCLFAGNPEVVVANEARMASGADLAKYAQLGLACAPDWMLANETFVDLKITEI